MGTAEIERNYWMETPRKRPLKVVDCLVKRMEESWLLIIETWRLRELLPPNPF